MLVIDTLLVIDILQNLTFIENVPYFVLYSGINFFLHQFGNTASVTTHMLMFAKRTQLYTVAKSDS